MQESPDAAALAALAASLADCRTVQSTCETVTDRLFELDLLVSVYLLQGDRLRCRSVQGYWQIFDGMLGGGVIGESFRSGQRMLVRQVGSSPHYLAAAPHVVDELCVPLLVRGAVVGVLNVESTSTLSPLQEQATDQAAAMLAQRLSALPLPSESAAQKLGRHGAALSALAATADTTTLLEAVARAAVDISGMESAALCVDVDSEPVVCAATGPFAERLRKLSTPELTGMAAWVATGTSSYTVGQTDGMGFPGHEQLRTQGAGSLVVLPLRSAGARRGMLVVTTQQVLNLRTEDVQLLELFAATVTTCLQIADNVQALRQRASADALTGLGHHATFHATLAPVRQRSGPDRLAVLYIDVDHFKSVNDTEGHAAGDKLLILLAECMQAALREDDLLFRIGGDEFAALAHVATAEQALGLAERLITAVHERSSVSLSVGVAVEAPGESDTALLARADAAVYAAKAAGRGVVRLSPPTRVAVPDPRAVGALGPGSG